MKEIIDNEEVNNAEDESKKMMEAEKRKDKDIEKVLVKGIVESLTRIISKKSTNKGKKGGKK